MTSKIKVERYTLPQCWACYLMYGDFSGLSEQEIEQADTYLRLLDGAYLVSVDDDSHFSWSNDANNDGYDVATFIFHRQANN